MEKKSTFWTHSQKASFDERGMMEEMENGL